MNILQKIFDAVKKWVCKRNGKHITLYCAVNKSGQYCIFIGEPFRDNLFEAWIGESDCSVSMVVSRMEALGFVLPKITWEDEPVELKLSLT